MNMPRAAGRPFMALPGPTNIPEPILRAMDRPTEDFNSPAFEALAAGCYRDLKRCVQDRGHHSLLGLFRPRRLGKHYR